MDIIAHNQTAGDLPLAQLSAPDAVIPASGQVTLSDFNTLFEIQADAQLLSYVNLDQVLLGIDTVVLNKTQTLAFLNPAVDPGQSQQSYAFFAHMLRLEGKYSESEIEVGLINEIYAQVSDLPTTPPSGTDVPAFAIVDTLINGQQLAYWDFTEAQTGWHLTSFPWTNPILMPGHVIKQVAVGTGNYSWQYSMGTMIHVLHDAQVRDMTIKLGSGPHSHAWTLLKSTSPGAAPPPASSFTTVLASGVHDYAIAQAWESVTGFPGIPIDVSENDWLAAMLWIGSGGQTATIDAERDAGNFNEDYGAIHAGIYVYTAGVAPGSTPTPTNIVTLTLYGMASIDLGPQ